MTAPMVWLRALRSAGFSHAHHRVLTALASRVHVDGSGYASTAQLAEDAGVSPATVRRATTAAQAAGYLAQTRRGHRLGNGATVANEWQLTVPQPLTDERLNQPQPLTGGVSTAHSCEHPRELSTKRARQLTRASARETRRLPYPVRTILQATDATEAEAVALAAKVIRERRPDKSRGFFRCLADDGDLPGLLGALRAATKAERVAGAARCARHPGQVAGHCGPCRSERIGAAR